MPAERKRPRDGSADPVKRVAGPPKRRHCRELRPARPSKDVLVEVASKAKALEDSHVANGWTFLENPPARARERQRVVEVRTGIVTRAATSRSATAIKLEHLRSLKSHTHKDAFFLAPFISPKTNERANTSGRNAIAIALRTHANATTFAKSSPTHQSSLQTTRFPTALVGVVHTAAQVTTAMVIGLGASGHARSASSGLFTTAASLLMRRNSPLESRDCIIATRSKPFHDSAARFLQPRDMRRIAIDLARDHLKTGLLSQIVRQTTAHLHEICARIVDEDESDGGAVAWLAWALLLFLATNVRFHSLLCARGVHELDIATALSLLAYAHGAIGNHARRSQAREATAKSAEDAVGCVEPRTAGGKRRSDASAPPPQASGALWRKHGDDDDDADTATTTTETGSAADSADAADVAGEMEAAAAAATRARIHALSKKSRRLHDVETALRGTDGAGGKAKVARGTDAELNRLKSLEYLLTTLAGYAPQMLVLHADTEAACREAGREVLYAQLEELDIARDHALSRDEALLAVAEHSASHTRALTHGLVAQDALHSPTLVTWTVASADGRQAASRAAWTTPAEGPGRLLACRMPGVDLQPPRSMGAAVAWALASSEVVPGTPHGQVGALAATWERKDAARCRENASVRCGSCNVARAAKTTHHLTNQARTPPLRSTESGLRRSVLCVEATLVVSRSVSDAAAAVRAATERALGDVAASTPLPDGASNHKLHGHVQTKLEPSMLPSNVFTVGMYMQEVAMSAVAQSARAQSFLVAQLTTEAIFAEDSQEDRRTEPARRPGALLPIVDLTFDQCDGDDASGVANDVSLPLSATEKRPCVQKTRLAVGLTVAGECATPVVALLNMLARAADNTERDTAARLRMLNQWRAVLYAAGIQCCTFEQFSASVAAKELNVKVEGTSKVDAPDCFYHSFPTVFQAYVVGHDMLPTLFEGTHWKGAYGAAYECGAVAAVGMNARCITSDARNASVSIVDAKQADELARNFANASMVAVDERTFVRAPLADLGGLPRALFAGVHAALNGLHGAFGFWRKACSVKATVAHAPEPTVASTQPSIQVLPCSPFSQAVPPHVAGAAVAMGVRDEDCGWAVSRGTVTPRPIGTLRASSILHSTRRMTLFDSIVLEMNSIDANVFETIEPAVASVLVFASQLHCVAEAIHDFAPAATKMQALRDAILAFASPKATRAQPDARVAALAADALVLINALYPTSLVVGEPCLLDAVAAAPNAVATADVAHLSKLPNVTAAKIKEARAFATTICSDDVFAPLAAFVLAVGRYGARYTNTIDDLDDAADKLEAFTRAAWHVHRRGAERPPASSPLHFRTSADDVQGADILMVWVDRPHACEPNRRIQRGCVIGLPNAGPQQVLTLLCASHLPNVLVQYVRNEGNMCLRVSACALKSSGAAPLSAKSTSPVYSDSDQAAFGSADAKAAQAARQVRAWELNNALISKATSVFSLKEDRSGGGAEDAAVIARALAGCKETGRVSVEQRAAGAFFEEAVRGSL